MGGHSIDDAQPKYGLTVTGTVHPDQILTKPGDVLVLMTGFGLVGHLHELCGASGCAARIVGSCVAALEGALALLE